jgi:TctA family transporter
LTIYWFIVACIAFMIATGVARSRPARALANMVVLGFAFAALGIADLVASRFIDTGRIALWIAAILAFGYALDALYGAMAPQRQRARDRKLRAFFRKGHA